MSVPESSTPDVAAVPLLQPEETTQSETTVPSADAEPEVTAAAAEPAGAAAVDSTAAAAAVVDLVVDVAANAAAAPDAPRSIQVESTPTPEGATQVESTPAPEETTQVESTPTPEGATQVESTPAPEEATQVVSTPTPEGGTASPIKLKIMTDKNVKDSSEDIYQVLVCVQTPDKGERQPVDLVCIIDTSGSMGMEATIQGTGGVTESHGLSLLDVAKHGVRTIIKTLGAKDRLSLVEFNHNATTVLPLTAMDETGQTKASEELDKLDTGGGTEIWNGLSHALDALREGTATEKGRFGHMMLLTDGESRNKETILPNLQEYKNKHERLPGTLNTFGFGYGIDSDLLIGLSTSGSGSYSFIPDAGFVGTVFVNTMSNLLVTMAREVYLTLGPEAGAKFAVRQSTETTISGGIPFEKTGESSLRVDLGTLQFGQTKDVVVPMMFFKDVGDEAFLVASVQYETLLGTVESVEGEGIASSDVDLKYVETQRCRCMFADALEKARNSRGVAASISSSEEMIKNTIELVKSSPACDEEKVKALLEDMCGQSLEAVSNAEFFKKWGVHYMPSLMFAHRLQQCNNFKDPGVQVYGGSLFATIRDEADDIFNNLPAPQPSVRSRVSAGTGYSAPVNMAAYNNCYGG